MGVRDGESSIRVVTCHYFWVLHGKERGDRTRREEKARKRNSKKAESMWSNTGTGVGFEEDEASEEEVLQMVKKIRGGGVLLPF